MKAISLWQPWASAVMIGLKKFETRHWKTAYRGPIAIHAAKRWQDDQKLRFRSANMNIALLFGKVIAIATLDEIYDLDLLGLFVTDLERSWGNYKPGRYGWALNNVQPLSRPFDFRGGQGIFNVPDELIRQAA